MLDLGIGGLVQESAGIMQPEIILIVIATAIIYFLTFRFKNWDDQ